PFMIIITMEALRAVPRGIREAAYGVGATRWEVVRSHVLPYAAPGIFTGAILSLARAFGETAPLLLVGAIQGYLSTPTGRTPVEILQGPYTALPMELFSWSNPPAARAPPGSLPAPADADLLLGQAARGGLGGEHGRGHHRAPGRDPRRELR